MNLFPAADATLDTSLNKPLSPTSSVTSQRKLEWDSLADVGYANEIDRKTSGSSLSTLERLALQQHYTNSDNQESGNLGQPSAHSTLLDTKQEPKKTNKKNLVKKTREIHQTEMDTVEVNVPHTVGNMPISVNLTKHISFNVERDRGVIVECNEKDITVNPEQKISVETKMSPEVRFDKQIQTSFTKSTTETSESNNKRKTQQGADTGPVLITLNTLRRRIKRRKRRTGKKKPSKRQPKTKPQEGHQQKSTEQVSEAESFEYMPGHIYNQNQIKDGHQKTRNSAGNKSSLESSGGITTESSNSFTKDLEKSIKLLNEVLQRHNDDSHLKKQLVKDVVRKLIKSDYKDDESDTEFLSGLSYNSKRLDLSKASHNYTTTSTSDMNNSGDTARRPKKSILRMDKFDSKALASNSQSAPNLPSVSTSNVPVITKLTPLFNIESDASCDKSFIKTSSEEIYKKYLEALRKEEAYKKHLKDKNDFLKQKLVGSDTALRAPEVQIPAVKPNKLKDLIKDLIRNNYDDGSGDASKLEGGPSSSNRNFPSNSEIRKQRNHSVFTLSSGNSDRKCIDRENRKLNLRKRLQDEIQASSSSNEGTSKAAMRREHFCCCPHHTSRCGFTDSSTQVNIDHCQNCDKRKTMTTNSCPCKMSHIGGVQMCSSVKPASPRKYQVQYGVNKGSDLDTQKEFDNRSRDSFDASVQCTGSRKTTPSGSPRVAFTQKPEITKPSTSQCVEFINVHPHRAIRASDEVIFEKWDQLTRKMSQSSQTNVAINIFTKKLDNKFCDCNNPMCTRKCSLEKSFTSTNLPQALNTASGNTKIHETTRSLQTEISIDPKISDPQLQDIVIINSEDLVQVISEHYREVSRSKLSETNDVELKYFKTFKDSETQFGTDTDIYTYMSPRVQIKSDNSLTCCRTQTYKPDDKQDAGSQSNLESVRQIEEFRLPSEFKIDTDSYAIPLEGTNMTLRVSIGTKDGKNTEPKPTTAGKSEKLDSPRVQYTADMFEALSDRSSCKESTIPSSIVERSDKVGNWAMMDGFCENKQKTFENPSNKYPTYPSVDKKQFLRTNTHPILEKKSDENVTEKEPVKKLEKKVCHIDTQADIPTEEKSIETLKSNLASMPASEKPNSTIGAKPLQKGETGSDACSNSLKHQVENPNKGNKYKTDATKSKLRNKNPHLQAKAPEKSGCNEYVNLSPKKAGISICHSQPSSLEEKADAQNKNNDKTKLCGGNIETAASLPTSARSTGSDPVMEKIQEITKRYGKKDLDKGKRKKCFNEIISVLNYLLETEDKPNLDKQECVEPASSNDTTDVSASCSKTTQDTSPPGNKLLTKCTKDSSTACSPKKLIDRAIQLTQRKSRNKLSSSESSDLPTSSDVQECSTDLATCKILNKIKKECEKYHNKRCKSHHNARCDSSSTSVHCGDCKKAPHCLCRTTKCKCKITSSFQKLKKKCVAYNLILQTSDSMMSDGQGKDEESKRELKSIVVKVPKRCCKPLPEYQSYLPHKYEQAQTKAQRPKSPTEDVPATDDYKKAHSLTVKEYLEKNRPDFIESATQRQSCLKMMEEHR